jgi:hypothetical protein
MRSFHIQINGTARDSTVATKWMAVASPGVID